MHIKVHQSTFSLELYARPMAQSMFVNARVSFVKERLS